MALVMIMVTMILILLKVMLMEVAIIHITLPHSPPAPLCRRAALLALHNESTVLVSLQRPLLRPQSTATQRCGRTL